MAETEGSPIVASAVVGDGGDDGGEWSAWRTIEWKLQNFSSLGQVLNEYVQCPSLKCHGMSWKLCVYPRGRDHGVPDFEEGYVAILIKPEDRPNDIPYKWNLLIKRRDTRRILLSTETPSATNKASLYPHTHPIHRRRLLAADSPFIGDDGALTIQIELQVKQKAEEIPTRYSAPNRKLGDDMRKILKSGKSSDVTFVVDGTSFPAHRHILEIRAPVLHELCEETLPGSEVPIDGVSAPIFEAVLDHVYTNGEPDTADLTRNARELLDAADRFGSSGLKLLAEAELAQRSGVNAGNVISLLLLADAKSCALLKEAATTYIASNPKEVMASEDWSQVKESSKLLAEIMEVIVGRDIDASAPGAEYDAMTVPALRRNLDDADLSVDGTREMLVKRLKTHHNRETTSSA